MAEQKVLQLMTQHNKPFNVQGLADFLATQGVKKAQVQKALDTLVESGKILMKVGAAAFLHSVMSCCACCACCAMLCMSHAVIPAC